MEFGYQESQEYQEKAFTDERVWRLDGLAALLMQVSRIKGICTARRDDGNPGSVGGCGK